ncbi:WG repeat-containing protein [Splendidivirga corallicola]|uniref:WG repeat-containing protein n=1 Tax=Splendidivirga corallicola TaxID=3051826 RepID=UPI003211ACF9
MNHLLKEDIDDGYHRTALLLNGYSIVARKNKQGLIDNYGELIIPISYQGIGWSDGQNRLLKSSIIGYKNNGYWGLITVKNHKLTQPIYTALKPFSSDLVVASKRENGSIRNVYGLMDSNLKTIISFKYDLLIPNGNELIASIKKDGEIVYGLINRREEVIISFGYKKIKAISSGSYAVTNKDNKTALFSSKGKELTKFEFDDINFIDNELGIVSIGNRNGLIDKNGKIRVKPIYKEISVNEDGNLVGLAYNQWQLLDGQNKLIGTLHYDKIEPVNRKILKVAAGKYQAIIDENDNPVTHLKPWQIREFNDGIAIVKENDYFGVIKDHSHILLPIKFDSLYRIEDYFITNKQISRDHIWSVYDMSGKRINQISYDLISGFSERFFSVKKNDRWGFMDFFGNEKIPARFDTVHAFTNGRAKVILKGLEGIINNQGKWIIQPRYENLEMVDPDLYIFEGQFFNGLVHKDDGEIYHTDHKLTLLNSNILEKNIDGKFGLFDRNGIRLLKTEYQYISELLDNKVHIFQDENYFGILNKIGGILIGADKEIQDIKSFKDDLLIIKASGKYGFMDLEGRIRIANRYDDIHEFSEGMAGIKLLGKWGYLNKDEEIVVQPKYDKIEAYLNGTAIVSKKGKYGLLDKSGNELAKVEFDALSRTTNGSFISLKQGKKGLINKEGNEIIYPRFDEVNDLGNGFILVNRDGKYGLITDQGVSTIPLIYDQLIYDKKSNYYLACQKADWEIIKK